MKLALTADWHIRGKDIAVACEQIEAMFTEAHARGCKAVLVAGDVFDRENIADAHANVGEIAGRVLGLLSHRNTHVYIVPGNHDFSGPSREPAIAILAMGNVFTFNEPGLYALDDNTVALFLPWSYSGQDPEQVIARLVEDAERKHPSKKRVLCGHVRVVGGKFNRFRTHEKRGNWDVRREFLEHLAVDRIALGDFHARQDLSNGRGGYVGAIRQLNFGEEGNPQGFEVWDSETGEVEWVEIPNAPRYFTQRIASNEELEDLDPMWLDSERVRYICEGFIPDRTLVQAREAQGAEVIQEVAAIERMQRAVEVPDGVLNDPMALIDLYASTLTEPVDTDRLKRLFREATAGLFHQQTGAAQSSACDPEQAVQPGGALSGAPPTLDFFGEVGT